MKVDKITEEVREDLLKRSEVGLKKYNMTLCEDNYSNFLQHAYEEALDLAQYLKKELKIREELLNITQTSIDDADIGKRVREFLKK